MMDDRLLQKNVILRRWVAVLILLMIVPLAISFNARLSTMRQMRQDERHLKQAVAVERVRQADLKSLLGYVSSDDCVEHWARVDARMVKPGEVSVIPVAPDNAQSNATAPAPIKPPLSILDEWWTVFFETFLP